MVISNVYVVEMKKTICTIKLHTSASILSLSDRQYLASAPLF